MIPLRGHPSQGGCDACRRPRVGVIRGLNGWARGAGTPAWRAAVGGARHRGAPRGAAAGVAGVSVGLCACGMVGWTRPPFLPPGASFWNRAGGGEAAADGRRGARGHGRTGGAAAAGGRGQDARAGGGGARGGGPPPRWPPRGAVRGAHPTNGRRARNRLTGAARAWRG